MKIALDYDLTYTLDPDFWGEMIYLAFRAGHDIRIVTARSPTLDNIDEKFNFEIPIIYCDGVAKRFVCAHYAKWVPDVWIDDKPQNIDNNSTATPEQLDEWRLSDAH